MCSAVCNTLQHTATHCNTHVYDTIIANVYATSIVEVCTIRVSPVFCSVLQCVAVCWWCRMCSIQVSSVCCSVLQCVAVCCSVLQCVDGVECVRYQYRQCVAVCCSVLQCVAVCCSVLWVILWVSHTSAERSFMNVFDTSSLFFHVGYGICRKIVHECVRHVE